MTVRITGIKKDRGNHYNPHEAVSDYQWLDSEGKTGIGTREQMVDWMVNKGGKAYVSSAEGSVWCYINKSLAGTSFLQTQSDKKWSNNLLNLPEV
jgi:hypothetical protein